ncbi:MAG: transposase [Phycisphaerae bacterium]|nr:transposase [Phycisphaerae bacterium]
MFDRAPAGGLIDARPEAVIDATGLERRHTSRYFVWRSGQRPHLRHAWPKLTLVCHTHSYLFAAAVVSPGPSQDSPQFPPAVRLACDHLPIDRLLADAGYDGEHNHRLAREELGIRSTIIKLNRRNARKWPTARYRRQMKRAFPKRV